MACFVKVRDRVGLTAAGQWFLLRRGPPLVRGSAVVLRHARRGRAHRRPAGRHDHAAAGRPRAVGAGVSPRRIAADRLHRKPRSCCSYDGETVDTVADLSDIVPANLGDMVVDEHGRAYVGSQAREGGVIVRVDPDDAVTVVAERPRLPQRHGHHARRRDADRRRVDRQAADRVHHRRRRVAVRPADLRRRARRAARRHRARRRRRGLGGDDAGPPVRANRSRAATVTDRIDIGDRTAIACTLGGPERRTLFLLSSTDAYPQRLVGTKLSRLDATTVDIPGAGSAMSRFVLRTGRRQRSAGREVRRDRPGAQHLVGRDPARRTGVGAAGPRAGALRGTRRHPAEPRADRPARAGTRRGRSVGARATRTLRQADRVDQRRDAGAGPGRSAASRRAGQRVAAAEARHRRRRARARAAAAPGRRRAEPRS